MHFTEWIRSDDDNGKSKETVFLRNHPNPFNSATSIGFVVSKAGNVSLTVFDLNGRKVKTLVDGYRDKGSYSITFNPKGLSSGIYLCRFVEGDFSVTKKIIFVK